MTTMESIVPTPEGMPVMRIVWLTTLAVLLVGSSSAVSDPPAPPGPALPQSAADSPQLAPIVSSESFCVFPEFSLPQCEGNGRIWTEVDYILYWMKPVCLTVPTVTAGNPNDRNPGAFGQPGTRLLQGIHKFEFAATSGSRATIGTWLSDDQFLGIEAGGFILAQAAAESPVHAVNGSPPLYIPFRNPNGTENALPFTIPGVVNGRSSAEGSSQWWGVESNLDLHISKCSGPWTLHATAIVGCRYLQLDDRVLITNRQSLVANSAVTAIGRADFQTTNQFIGGQVGSRFGLSNGPLSADLTTKLALGETYLSIDVAGNPLVSAPVAPPLVPGPFLALRSNIGTQSSDRISVVPEVNATMAYQVTPHLRVTLGYNVLYWNKILCPGDEMDPHVNPTLLPFRGPLVGTPAPAPKFVFSDSFVQGLQAGLAFGF